MCPTNQPKRRTLGFTRKCSSLPERLDEEDGKDDEEVAEDGGQDQDQHQDQQRRRDHVAASHKVYPGQAPSKDDEYSVLARKKSFISISALWVLEREKILSPSTYMEYGL